MKGERDVFCRVLALIKKGVEGFTRQLLFSCLGVQVQVVCALPGEIGSTRDLLLRCILCSEIHVLSDVRLDFPSTGLIFRFRRRSVAGYNSL